jgi:hypothetical protein
MRFVASLISDIKVIVYSLALIFNLLTIRKGNLLEVEKEMFHVVAWHCLFILCLLLTPNCNLCKLGKSIIRLVPRPVMNFWPSWRIKIRLVDFEKTIIHGVA